MEKRIAVLPGDGIGPEVVAEGLKVMDAVASRLRHSFKYEFGSIGADAIDKYQVALPPQTLDICKNADAVILGAIGDPKYDKDPSAPIRPEMGLLQLRSELKLFANLRPVRAYEHLLSRSPLKESIVRGAAFTVFRELTGGIYFGDKGRTDDGKTAFDHCGYSDYEVDRIARMAFDFAQKRGLKLTLVDKANVLETSRLWRERVREMAMSYPTVELEMMYVDNAAMQIIRNPGAFGVILTENMFGDILSDAASVIPGSLGLLPSASIGQEGALFEPVHGSYPEAAGKDIANPIAMILSVAMMFDYLDLQGEADLIREAVEHSLNSGIMTEDLSAEGAFSCSEVGSNIARYISSKTPTTDHSKSNIILGKSTII